MERFISVARLFLLLIILPAGSWFYLRQGLNFRKDVLKEITPKGQFPSTLYNNGLLGNASVIQLVDDSAVSAQIYEQFGKQKRFVLCTPNVNNSVNQENWKIIVDSTLDNIKESYKNISFLLLDTALQIRHTYATKLPDDLKALVLHTSAVIPKEKPKDIKMKK